jgi:hypothetical protein
MSWSLIIIIVLVGVIAFLLWGFWPREDKSGGM